MALATAASFSDYLENAILQWFRGTAFPSVPASFYIGLFTTNPLDTGTTGGTTDGTEMSTTNGTLGFTNYARVAVAASTAGWTAPAVATGDTVPNASGQQISNAALLPASGTSWTNNGGSTVTVAGIGCYDALTNGHLLFYIPLTVPQAITNGVAFAIPIAGLVFQVD